MTNRARMRSLIARGRKSFARLFPPRRVIAFSLVVVAIGAFALTVRDWAHVPPANRLEFQLLAFPLDCSMDRVDFTADLRELEPQVRLRWQSDCPRLDRVLITSAGELPWHAFSRSATVHRSRDEEAKEWTYHLLPEPGQRMPMDIVLFGPPRSRLVDSLTGRGTMSIYLSTSPDARNGRVTLLLPPGRQIAESVPPPVISARGRGAYTWGFVAPSDGVTLQVPGLFGEAAVINAVLEAPAMRQVLIASWDVSLVLFGWSLGWMPGWLGVSRKTDQPDRED